MDDQLLKDLGILARQQDDADRSRLDERWDRLAAGTLTAEEDAELRALAEASPEGRETYEAFRPLGNDFQARVVSAIIEERKGKARILPFRRIEVWVGAAAALAASLFLVVRITAPPPQPLPPYDGTLTGGSMAERGSEPGPARYAPGSRLIWTMTAETAVTDQLEARCFLSPQGAADLRPWQPPPHIELKGKGTVICDGKLGKDIQSGTWTILGVVARSGKIPDTKDLQAELRAGTGHADWQAASGSFQVGNPIDP